MDWLQNGGWVWKEHTVAAGSGRFEADGYIESAAGEKMQMDIVVYTSIYSDLTDASVVEAAKVWNNGGVYVLPASEFGVPALLVPGDGEGRLTANVIFDALSRYAVSVGVAEDMLFTCGVNLSLSLNFPQMQ